MFAALSSHLTSVSGDCWLVPRLVPGRGGVAAVARASRMSRSTGALPGPQRWTMGRRLTERVRRPVRAGLAWKTVTDGLV